MHLLKDKDPYYLTQSNFEIALSFYDYKEDEEFNKNPMRFLNLNFITLTYAYSTQTWNDAFNKARKIKPIKCGRDRF